MVRASVRTRATFATASSQRNVNRYDEAVAMVARVLTEARTIGYLPLLSNALRSSGALQFELGRAAGRAQVIEAVTTGLRGGDDFAVAQACDQLVDVDADAPGGLGGLWSELADAALARVG